MRIHRVNDWAWDSIFPVIFLCVFSNICGHPLRDFINFSSLEVMDLRTDPLAVVIQKCEF
jgi:hypothetical protein